MRTNKRTTMLRTFTAAFALAVGMFTGFAENTLGLNGKYWWIDNVDGVNQPREANYLDRVTNENPRQMKALVASVLADQSVPGQLTMIGYDGTDKPVDYTIYRNSSNSYYISTSFFNNYNI